MSDRALSPEALDRIEDLLEDLERDGFAEDLADAEPEVAHTLRAYRSILALTREAMPTVDVPAGLLDEVIAEARRTGAAAPSRARAQKDPWYRRLRWWGPALAFAGSAALLLVLVRPLDEANDATSNEVGRESVAGAAAEDAKVAPVLPESSHEGELRLADAQTKREEPNAFAELDRDESRAAALDPAAAAHVPYAATPDDDAPAEEEADGELAFGRRKTAGKGGTSSKSATSSSAPIGGGTERSRNASDKKTMPAGPLPAPAQKPMPAPEPKTPAPTSKSDAGGSTGKDEADPWADIALGDTKRRAGACSTARPAYERATKSTHAGVRARGFAGLGLCDLDEDKSASAETWFDKARAADPKVAPFITAERSRHEPAE